MGAWGIGAFENDDALDVLDSLREGEFSFAEVEWAFEDDHYLEANGGQIAVALAELAIAVNRGQPERVEDLELSTIAGHFTDENLRFLRNQVARALSGAETSELYELWADTEDFPQWLAATESLQRRLASIGN
ncbi:hypothetical protein GCM10027417_29240 [Glutamicibacter endophyticus]|uniref:DUF4259 domain-containing protein n=1 Tax=Glutamicibacter sp. PS TaxID=3075634 RepID=UPI002846256B|nr:DUF4259 domain-containing protein [Glutamicibacter sp. PS]MDR4534766.1 DUF4259 domain-containing protein [Glutamicibacter sp. PS]